VSVTFLIFAVVDVQHRPYKLRFVH